MAVPIITSLKVNRDHSPMLGLLGSFLRNDNKTTFERKPVFRCGGRLRVIARIGAPPVIARILEHLGRDAESVDPAHPSRAPPACDLSI